MVLEARRRRETEVLEAVVAAAAVRDEVVRGRRERVPEVGHHEVGRVGRREAASGVAAQVRVERLQRLTVAGQVDPRGRQREGQQHGGRRRHGGGRSELLLLEQQLLRGGDAGGRGSRGGGAAPCPRRGRLQRVRERRDVAHGETQRRDLGELLADALLVVVLLLLLTELVRGVVGRHRASQRLEGGVDLAHAVALPRVGGLASVLAQRRRLLLAAGAGASPRRGRPHEGGGSGGRREPGVVVEAAPLQRPRTQRVLAGGRG